MDDNYTLKIDPNTRDLVLDDDGVMVTVAGPLTSAQCVRLTLQAWRGEFPFVPSHGTEYERIMGKKPSRMKSPRSSGMPFSRSLTFRRCRRCPTTTWRGGRWRCPSLEGWPMVRLSMRR